jgi:steroid 5-alpha reductase family enzyme
LNKGIDSRFDNIRGNFWKFGGFWLLQGVTVWVIMIPSILFLREFEKVFTDPESVRGMLFEIGFLIWFVGFVVEWVADVQKSNWKLNLANKGKWIDVGLWKHSRHPNYFGEIAMWLGIYIFTLPVLIQLGVWVTVAAFISPLYIYTTISFFSGVRILEKRADEKWGYIPQYVEYKKNTNLLIPWF